MMKHTLKLSLLAVTGVALWVTDLAPDLPVLPTVARTAEAVVGRPLTPVSVGGVARRTTRRAVYAGSASAAQQQQAQQEQAQQQQAQPQQAQQQAAAAPPKGSMVTALPEGCESMTIDGGSYFNCAGTVYKPTFQSGNLVYIVQ